MIAAIAKPRPVSHIQNPLAAKRGKAMERAPSCKGTTAIAKPRRSGTTAPKVSNSRAVAKTWVTDFSERI